MDEECAYLFSSSRGVLNIPKYGAFGIGSYSAVLLLYVGLKTMGYIR